MKEKLFDTAGVTATTKGSHVLTFGFLDQNYDFILPPAETWRDSSKNREKLKNRGIIQFFFFDFFYQIFVSLLFLRKINKYEDI